MCPQRRGASMRLPPAAVGRSMSLSTRSPSCIVTTPPCFENLLQGPFTQVLTLTVAAAEFVAGARSAHAGATSTKATRAGGDLRPFTV